jgi:hypothetical protein
MSNGLLFTANGEIQQVIPLTERPFSQQLMLCGLQFSQSSNCPKQFPKRSETAMLGE